MTTTTTRYRCPNCDDEDHLEVSAGGYGEENDVIDPDICRHRFSCHQCNKSSELPADVKLIWDDDVVCECEEEQQQTHRRNIAAHNASGAAVCDRCGDAADWANGNVLEGSGGWVHAANNNTKCINTDGYIKVTVPQAT